MRAHSVTITHMGPMGSPFDSRNMGSHDMALRTGLSPPVVLVGLPELLLLPQVSAAEALAVRDALVTAGQEAMWAPINFEEQMMGLGNQAPVRCLLVAAEQEWLSVARSACDVALVEPSLLPPHARIDSTPAVQHTHQALPGSLDRVEFVAACAAQGNPDDETRYLVDLLAGRAPDIWRCMRGRLRGALAATSNAWQLSAVLLCHVCCAPAVLCALHCP